MQTVVCELSEPLVLDGRWIVTVVGTEGDKVVVSLRDRNNPGYEEQFVLQAGSVDSRLELAIR